MKAFIILAVCLVAVTAKVTIVRRTMPKSNASADDEKTMKQCLKDHNIDPDILSESAEDKEDKVDPVSLLSDKDLGCLHACVYSGSRYMKPDGTLDFDQLLEGGEKHPEAQWERKVYETAEEACRAGAGDNNCRFFQCMIKFSPTKLKPAASLTC